MCGFKGVRNLTEKCPSCGRRIGRLAKIRRDLMMKSAKTNPRAFASKFQDAIKELDEAIWNRLDHVQRRILKKAKKRASKIMKKRKGR